MHGYLILLLFIAFPFVELALLIKIGQYIGVGSTLGIVIITGAAGAYLAKHQGLRTLRRIQEEVNQGRMPADKLFDGFIILCSGLLLLTPGFITDLIGFLGLIPNTRNAAKQWLMRKLRDAISRGKVPRSTSFRIHR